MGVLHDANDVRLFNQFQCDLIFRQGSVLADMTHIDAHLSASNMAAVGLRSILPVQTIRTFFMVVDRRSPDGAALLHSAQAQIVVFGLNGDAIVEALELACQAGQRLVSLLQLGIKMPHQRF